VAKTSSRTSKICRSRAVSEFGGPRVAHPRQSSPGGGVSLRAALLDPRAAVSTPGRPGISFAIACPFCGCGARFHAGTSAGSPSDRVTDIPMAPSAPNTASRDIQRGSCRNPVRPSSASRLRAAAREPADREACSGRIATAGIADGVAVATAPCSSVSRARVRSVGGTSVWVDYTRCSTSSRRRLRYAGTSRSTQVRVELERSDVLLLQPSATSPSP